MSQRLQDAFEGAPRARFIAYVCAGDPDYDRSLAICRSLLEAGVDILELGVPFSDPVADGVVNQLASQRALESGMNLLRVFELAATLRAQSDKPIILYLYYNLIFQRGLERFAQEAVEAGIDGVLALDCPPEEASEWVEVSQKAGLANIFIIAPTTPAERIAMICEKASGFLYYVSRLGVTGERDQLAADLGEGVNRIREHSKLPVAVGFGVSRPEHVAAVAEVADGVVVGSALVRLIGEGADSGEDLAATLGAKARELVNGLPT